MVELTRDQRLTPALEGVSAAWLIQGRWLAYPVTAAITAAAAHEMRLALPLTFLAGLLAFALSGNLLAHFALRQRWLAPRRLTEVALICDISMITALVVGTGSQSSPVLLTFLLPPIVAATCLGRRPTWTIVGLAVLAMVAVNHAGAPVFFDHQHADPASAAGAASPAQLPSRAAIEPAPDASRRDTLRPHQKATEHVHETSSAGHSPQVHLWSHVRGAWLSLSLFGLLIVNMLRSAVAQHRRELSRVQSEATHHKQVAEVASVAANIAHSLGSPLSTVVMLAEDLARDLERQGANPQWQRDLRHINEQLSRCQDLLRRGGTAGSDARLEPATDVGLASLLLEAKEQTERPDLVTVRLSEANREATNRLPRHATLQLLIVLLENGLQAAPGRRVLVEASVSAREWEIGIEDTGPGLSEDVARAIGKRPITTKPHGMGIGLLLGGTLLERVGGTLTFRMGKGGRGTRAILTLPTFRAAACVDDGERASGSDRTPVFDAFAPQARRITFNQGPA